MTNEITVTTNLNNWTSEEVTVTARDGNFEMYGYDWKIGEFVDVWKGAGYRPLFREGIDHVAVHVNSADMAVALRNSVIWIANHV